MKTVAPGMKWITFSRQSAVYWQEEFTICWKRWFFFPEWSPKTGSHILSISTVVIASQMLVHILEEKFDLIPKFLIFLIVEEKADLIPKFLIFSSL